MQHISVVTTEQWLITAAHMDSILLSARVVITAMQPSRTSSKGLLMLQRSLSIWKPQASINQMASKLIEPPLFLGGGKVLVWDATCFVPLSKLHPPLTPRSMAFIGLLPLRLPRKAMMGLLHRARPPTVRRFGKPPRFAQAER